MKAFTLKSSIGILRVLISDIGVSIPFLGNEQTPIVPFKGIWDTGASGSVITKNVVDQLGLKPTGQTIVNHAQGSGITNTYLVNLALPMNVLVQSVKVTEGQLPNGVDLLIGMDIITLGDFSVTNKDGVTVMSFRMPSLVCHDYVPEAKNHAIFEQAKAQRQAKAAQAKSISRKPNYKKKRK